MANERDGLIYRTKRKANPGSREGDGDQHSWE